MLCPSLHACIAVIFCGAPMSLWHFGFHRSDHCSWLCQVFSCCSVGVVLCRPNVSVASHAVFLYFICCSCFPMWLEKNKPRMFYGVAYVFCLAAVVFLFMVFMIPTIGCARISPMLLFLSHGSPFPIYVLWFFHSLLFPQYPFTITTMYFFFYKLKTRMSTYMYHTFGTWAFNKCSTRSGHNMA